MGSGLEFAESAELNLAFRSNAEFKALIPMKPPKMLKIKT
jgi:hypothetical protein